VLEKKLGDCLLEKSREENAEVTSEVGSRLELILFYRVDPLKGRTKATSGSLYRSSTSGHLVDVAEGLGSFAEASTYALLVSGRTLDCRKEVVVCD
jgi:hypothetical protein